MKVQSFLETNPYIRVPNAASSTSAGRGLEGQNLVSKSPEGRNSVSKSLEGQNLRKSLEVRNPEEKKPEGQSSDREKLSYDTQLHVGAAEYTTAGGRIAGELIRELKPVNVHPKHATAIDTFLIVAHYTGGDSIINTHA